VAARQKDPTEAMRLKASQYPGVDKGTSCTQSSFKTGGKAFLYCGPQGGRYKAMFKLDKSKAEAAKLAEKSPDDYQVSSAAWVTARFSADKPMPVKRWSRWLDESCALSQAPPKKKAARKKAATKKAVRRK
jgi:hypothetical protein